MKQPHSIAATVVSLLILADVLAFESLTPVYGSPQSSTNANYSQTGPGAVPRSVAQALTQSTYFDVGHDTFAHACSAAVSASKTLLVTKAWTSVPTQTCAANLRFEGAGSLQPAKGATVTLSGSVTGPTSQIFDQSPGGTVTLSKPQITIGDWWGAVPGSVNVGNTVLPVSLPTSALAIGASPSASAAVNTSAIQGALNAFACGGEILFPAGTWVINPITVPNNGCLYTLRGTTRKETILQAATDAASPTAIITAQGSSGARTYLRVASVSIECASKINIYGIYIDWGSPVSEIQDVSVHDCVSGIVVGNNFGIKLLGVTSSSNSTDGLTLGKLLDGSTPAASNSVLLVDTNLPANGRYGLNASGTRTLSIVGGDLESNGNANVLCSVCYGVSISGSYSESSGSLTSEAQFHFMSSQGVVITSQEISNTATTPIIKAESSDVTLVGLSVEHSTILTSTAVQAIDSAVHLLGGTIGHISTGVDISGISNVQIADLSFSAVSVPVTTTNVNTIRLDWNSVTDALLSASTLGASVKYSLRYTDGRSTFPLIRIGTPAAQQTDLDINGPVNNDGAAFFAPFLSTSANDWMGIAIGRAYAVGQAGILRFHQNYSTDNGYVTFQIYGDGPTTGLNLTKGGRVGVGMIPPASPFGVASLPVYANNAAAIAGGLSAGEFYRSGSDPDGAN